jgi:hypothetical protein
MHALLAINWEPQIRGILIIIISVTVLCGSIYLILGTNVGARLGFLLSLAALSGWMMIMGAVWWTFGIGLKGEEASWKAMQSTAILQNGDAFREVGLLNEPLGITADTSFLDQASKIGDALQTQGWRVVGESESAFGQSASAGGFVIEQDGSFAAGEYKAIRVFDKGGERYPKIGNSIDFLAFLHKPHYIVVEIAPLVPQRAENGRAPAPAELDATQGHRFVYMYRDLGHKRLPGAIIFFAAGLVFFCCAYLLHVRDRRVTTHLSGGLAVPAKA